MGYVSADGVTETSERSTEEIRAWGGQKIRTVQTEYGTSLSLTLIESRNATALRFVFGDDNVDVSGGEITVKRNEKTLPYVQLLVRRCLMATTLATLTWAALRLPRLEM